MSGVADDLKGALIDGYAAYVADRVRAQRLEIPAGFEDALHDGATWLRSALDDLLARPYAQQPRGPLEVFQEAMRFPTEALLAGAAEPVARDPGSRAALPGDLFNLAPASSRQISERAWLAHLAWGADKARGVAQARVVVFLTGNLMDRTRLESAISLSGAGHRPWRGAESLEDPKPHLLIVDLEHQEAMAATELGVEAHVPVVAYGPHADRERLNRARRAGARVEARSAFFSDPNRWLV